MYSALTWQYKKTICQSQWNQQTNILNISNPFNYGIGDSFTSVLNHLLYLKKKKKNPLLLDIGFLVAQLFSHRLLKFYCRFQYIASRVTTFQQFGLYFVLRDITSLWTGDSEAGGWQQRAASELKSRLTQSAVDQSNKLEMQKYVVSSFVYTEASLKKNCNFIIFCL